MSGLFSFANGDGMQPVADTDAVIDGHYAGAGVKRDVFCLPRVARDAFDFGLPNLSAVLMRRRLSSGAVLAGFAKSKGRQLFKPKSNFADGNLITMTQHCVVCEAAVQLNDIQRISHIKYGPARRAANFKMLL